MAVPLVSVCMTTATRSVLGRDSVTSNNSSPALSAVLVSATDTSSLCLGPRFSVGELVRTLTRGVAGLLRKNKVESIAGLATLRGGGKVEIAPHGDGERRTLTVRHIVLATGSVPVRIPVAEVDGDRIVDNEGALAFSEVPQRLGIIGAGVIGLELGSVWARLGSEVAVLEALDDFLPAADRRVAGEALKVLRRQGLDIRLGARVTGARAHEKGVAVGYDDKVIADAATDRILGVHVLAANASELIAEAVVAMAFDASAEDIARTIHAHPTLAEAMHEAALAVDGRAIHF